MSSNSLERLEHSGGVVANEAMELKPDLLRRKNSVEAAYITGKDHTNVLNMIHSQQRDGMKYRLRTYIDNCAMLVGEDDAEWKFYHLHSTLFSSPKVSRNKFPSQVFEILQYSFSGWALT